MPTADDLPEPAAEPTINDLDSAYQAGVDAGMDGFRWLRSALMVLTADIHEGREGSMECQAIRQMRVESANMISRLFRGVLPEDGEK